jgi:hypothetical protein
MRRRITFFMFIAIFILTIPNAYAGWIVDTGPGPSSGGGLVLSNHDAWFAGRFTLNDNYTITDIDAWLVSSLYGHLTYKIYGDSSTGTVPGSSLINSTTIERLFNQSNFVPDWVGPSGLNWDLSAGTYWLALEVTDSFEAALLYPPVSPLSAYAINQQGVWRPYSTDQYPRFTFGVRIYGETQVPEPATVLLLGLGLAGLAGMRRK